MKCVLAAVLLVVVSCDPQFLKRSPRASIIVFDQNTNQPSTVATPRSLQELLRILRERRGFHYLIKPTVTSTTARTTTTRKTTPRRIVTTEAPTTTKPASFRRARFSQIDSKTYKKFIGIYEQTSLIHVEDNKRTQLDGEQFVYIQEDEENVLQVSNHGSHTYLAFNGKVHKDRADKTRVGRMKTDNVIVSTVSEAGKITETERYEFVINGLTLKITTTIGSDTFIQTLRRFK